MIGTANSGTVVFSTASGTLSLGVTTGTNRVLVVAPISDFSGRTIDSVTWAGSAMTKIVGTVVNNESRAELWYIQNPAISTANVVVNCSDAVNGVIMAQVLTGVSPVSPTNASGGSANTSGNAISNLTTTKNNSFILDCLISHEGVSGAITKDAAQTLIYDLEQPGAKAFDCGLSYKTLPTAGTTSMGWTITGGGNWAHVAAAFTPLVGGIIAGEI